METDIHFWSYLAHFFLDWEMFQTNFVQIIKIHILYPVNPAVCEVMWKNIVEPERPQMTVWRICISCCIPKATNTLSEYVLLIAFPLQHWLHMCASMLHYTYIACLVYITIYKIQLKYFSFRFICVKWSTKKNSLSLYLVWLGLYLQWTNVRVCEVHRRADSVWNIHTYVLEFGLIFQLLLTVTLSQLIILRGLMANWWLPVVL